MKSQFFKDGLNFVFVHNLISVRVFICCYLGVNVMNVWKTYYKSINSSIILHLFKQITQICNLMNTLEGSLGVQYLAKGDWSRQGSNNQPWLVDDLL